MSWPARTWVALETVTAALFNEYVRDPLADLRAGGIAIASQVANDIFLASSSTQWTRLAAQAGKGPRFNGSSVWEMANVVAEANWPVGSVYESVLATNPATLLGIGTWTAFGAGRVTVGIDAGDADFDTVEETGGSKTVTLTSAEMPSHNHTQDAHTHVQNSHNHTQNAHDHTFANCANTINVAAAGPPDTTVIDNAGTKATTNTTAVNLAATATNNAATATNQSTGGGGAHTNLQPYVVIYRWKRTA